MTISEHVRVRPFVQTGDCWSDSAEICPKMTLVHKQFFWVFPASFSHLASRKKASFMMLPMSFLNICPTHRHFLLVNITMMSSCSHMVLTSAFEIFSGHLVRRIIRRHLWMKILVHPTVFLCHCSNYSLLNIPLKPEHWNSFLLVALWFLAVESYFLLLQYPR